MTVTTRPILCGPFPGNLGDTLTLTQPPSSPITIGAGAQYYWSTGHPTIANEEWFLHILKYVSSPPTFSDTTITTALATAADFTQQNSSTGTQINVTPNADAISLFATASIGAGTSYPTVSMTSDTAPSPLVANDNTGGTTGYPPYEVFNPHGGGNKSGSEWYIPYATGTPWWLSLDLGSGNGIAPYSYIVNCNGSPGGATTYMAAWTFQGSNDNSSWTTLDTQTAQGANTSASGGHTYVLSSPGPTTYRYFRWYNISEVGPATYGLEVEAMAIIAQAVSSYTYPTSTMYYVYMNSNIALDLTRYVGGSIASVTITNSVPSGGTLVGFVSTDGGTTWYYWTGSAWTSITLSAANLAAHGNTMATLQTQLAIAIASLPGAQTSLAFAWGLETTNSANTPTVSGVTVVFQPAARYETARLGGYGSSADVAVGRLSSTQTMLKNQTAAPLQLQVTVGTP